MSAKHDGMVVMLSLTVPKIMEINKLDKADINLREGNINEAIDCLLEYSLSIENKELNNLASTLQSRWSSIKTQNIQGIISSQEYQLFFNKIVVDLRKLISDSQDNTLKATNIVSGKSKNLPFRGKFTFVLVFFILVITLLFTLAINKFIIQRQPPNLEINNIRESAKSAYKCYEKVLKGISPNRVNEDSLIILNLKINDLKNISILSDSEIEKSKEYYIQLIEKSKLLCPNN